MTDVPPALSPPGSPDDPTAALQPADILESAILSCAGVDSLSGGRFGEIATYLPHRRVLGIRIADDHVDVHVVARWGVPVPEVVDQVCTASSSVAAGRAVNVFVDDVAVPPAESPSRASAESVQP